MLEVKPIIDGELEILYKRIYENDEIVILMWFSILGSTIIVGYAIWSFKFLLILNRFLTHTIYHILKFLQL